MHDTPTPYAVRWDALAALAILVAFVALNLYDAWYLHLWYDEGWTLAEITGVLTPEGINLPKGGPVPSETLRAATLEPGPFSNVADSLYARDVHPPLYFQALWVWAHAFGTSPLALRSLSVLCMALTAALIFWHSRRSTGPAAILALTLLFASPGAAYAAVNARGYGLGLLLSALVMVALLRAIEGKRPVRWALVAGAAAGAAAMTHYFALLTLVPVGIGAAIFMAGRRQWGALLAALLAAAPGLATAVLVWLPQHLGARPQQMQGFGAWPVELLSLFRVFVNQFTRYTLDNIPFALTITLLGAIGLAAILRQGWHGRTNPAVALPFLGVVGCMGGLLLLFWATDKTLLSFSVPRYGVLALPSLALLLAQLPSPRLAQRPGFVLACAAAIAAAGLWPRMDGANFDQPWANHAPSMGGKAALAKAGQGDLIVITGSEPGQLGTTLPSLPTGIPTLYAPNGGILAKALEDDAIRTLHMRPVPWREEPGLLPFPQAIFDAAEAAGFANTKGITWTRAVPTP